MTNGEQTPQVAIPVKTCDIVLKGGITSGVVYPLALTELAKQYRFSSIGGTSAGAIAAAAAAAAEYGRQTGHPGFERLAQIPDEIGPKLLGMFQPTPALRPIFNMFIAALLARSKAARIAAVIGAALKGYWGSAICGAVLGILIIVIAAISGGGAGWFAFGTLTAVLGILAAILLRLWKAATVDLEKSDFGMCPGITQPYAKSEAFTDWLARLINEAAGRPGENGPPLTFGDLDPQTNGGGPDINLEMMTTSLMEERPYTLPMTNKRFFFKKSEWDNIFPVWIMSYLTTNCESFPPDAGLQAEFFHLPLKEHLPLVVAARMSLSFPILISAVPLWARDETLCKDEEKKKLRRCLFSDGGLSSNFPIHFFDHILPNSPTFAITLDDFDPNRNRGNVWLPKTARSGIDLPILPFSGLGEFLMRLMYSAKDWQDNLQSTLPGYRERIAHIALEPDEGGLNLTMDETVITKLAGYGEQAGKLLRDQFDFNEHRWRRFLVTMAKMEGTLDDVAKAYQGGPGVPQSFAQFLGEYAQHPEQYRQQPGPLQAMLKRGEELAAEGVDWRTPPRIRDGIIPKPDTILHIGPKP